MRLDVVSTGSSTYVMVGIVDKCEHGGARDRCSMFALTLRRNSRRDQVELNARDTLPVQ